MSVRRAARRGLADARRDATADSRRRRRRRRHDRHLDRDGQVAASGAAFPVVDRLEESRIPRTRAASPERRRRLRPTPAVRGGGRRRPIALAVAVARHRDLPAAGAREGRGRAAAPGQRSAPAERDNPRRCAVVVAADRPARTDASTAAAALEAALRVQLRRRGRPGGAAVRRRRAAAVVPVPVARRGRGHGAGTPATDGRSRTVGGRGGVLPRVGGRCKPVEAGTVTAGRCSCRPSITDFIVVVVVYYARWQHKTHVALKSSVKYSLKLLQQLVRNAGKYSATEQVEAGTRDQGGAAPDVGDVNFCLGQFRLGVTVGDFPSFNTCFCEVLSLYRMWKASERSLHAQLRVAMQQKAELQQRLHDAELASAERLTVT